MIYNFDAYDKLLEIKSNFNEIELLLDSLAISTSEYRSFYNKLDIDFAIAKKVIHKSEYSLIIDCFTFAELLLKNTIYHSLDFNNSKNKDINSFLNEKISPEKFSPNVRFDKFENEIQKFNNENKFIINKNHNAVRIYNEMVISRHRYAHGNTYPQDFREYKDSILILEYLYWECNLFLKNRKLKNAIQDDFMDFISQTKLILKIKNNSKYFRDIIETDEIKQKVNPKSYKKLARKIVIRYEDELRNLTIFNEFIECLKLISEVDLRSVKIIEVQRIIDKIKEFTY